MYVHIYSVLEPGCKFKSLFVVSTLILSLALRFVSCILQC